MKPSLWWSNDLRSSWRNFDHFFWYKTSWKKTVFRVAFHWFSKEIVFSPNQKEPFHLPESTKRFLNPEGRETPEAKPVIRSWDLSRVHCRFYLKMASHHPSFILKLCSLAIPLTLGGGGFIMVVEDGMNDHDGFSERKIIQQIGHFWWDDVNFRMLFMTCSLFESRHWSNQTSKGGKLLVRITDTWSFRNAVFGDIFAFFSQNWT